MNLRESLSESEIEIRKPVWLAFSDLYLDTDVADSYRYIARTCAESPYTLEQLQHILVFEVAPVVSPNLLAVAGVWDGFDKEWLFSSILKNEYKSIHSKLHWRIARLFGFFNYTLRHWSKILPIVERERNNA